MAVSRDLASGFERVAERAIVLPVEPYDGIAMDTNQLLPSGPPVLRPDGEVWFYYSAARFGGMSVADHRKFDGARELFRLGVRPSDFENNSALCLAKLRPDGRGYFPWENFFEVFKQGQEDEQLHNIIGTVVGGGEVIGAMHGHARLYGRCR